MNENPTQNLSLARNLKISLFHLGSGMADVLGTGVWNRIMISDLGYSATPISLLLSLRYFLAPLGIWAGRISDQRTIGGYRRLFWVWLGRAMMAFGLLTLGLGTAELARANDSPLSWLVIILSLLLFSLGNAFSGSTFLALIYDVAPEHQRGRAVGLVWAFLLLGFSVAGFFFGMLVPSAAESENGAGFTPDMLQTLFIVAAVVLSLLWFFSLLGEERRNQAITKNQPEPVDSAFRNDLKLVWQDQNMRRFFWFLTLTMVFGFAQDTILEPFGGDVFGMDAKHTTRFAAYWGSMAILATLVFLWLSRRYKRLTSTVMSFIGVAILAATFGLFAVAGLWNLRALVTPGLVLLGIGLGIWNIGMLSMMMEFSPAGRAGTFLGFWTMMVTLARGLGIASGGIIRDIGLSLTSDLALSYVLVFIIEAVGLLVTLWILSHISVQTFQVEQSQKQQQVDTATILAGAME
jgi:MFS transporter, BCD family, chlorophyll transporter